MKKIELAKALDNTGIKKKVLSEHLGFDPSYYSRFIKRGTVSRPQATVIEQLTNTNIEDIDVEVR